MNNNTNFNRSPGQQNASRPTQNGARPTQNGARPTQNGARPVQNSGKTPKKKMRFHPNKDGIMAILVLLLIVVLVITIIVCIVKAISDAVSSGNDDTTETTITTIDTSTTTEATTVITDIVTTSPVVGAWNEGYVLENYSNSKVNEGNLVLVNYANEYTFPATMEKKIVDMYGQTGHGSVYVLGSGVKLNTTIISSLAQMLTEMRAANTLTLGSGDRIMINSGYRTLDYQQTLYDKAVSNGTEGYSARAGYSEHHTGLAFDIKIYTSKSATVDLRANEQDWIMANCAKYGFILRYPAEKTDITQILEESWHFRYVGVPHAQYIMENDLCLEEYIDLLREKYTYGVNEPLNYTVDGTEYIIYFVPASLVNDTTSVTVPASGTYTVSGNNVDGFIVTVTK